MPDPQQPAGAPPAPWDTPTQPQQPQPQQPGQPSTTYPAPAPQPQPPLQPGQRLTDGGIVVPNQGHAPQSPAADQPPQVQPQGHQVPEGPWSEIACHRSWLMGGRPVARQTQSPPVVDPRTQQIIDPGGQVKEEIIMLPVPSPYPCLGPKCSLFNAERGKCAERLLMDAKLQLVEKQLQPLEFAASTEPAPEPTPEPAPEPASEADPVTADPPA